MPATPPPRSWPRFGSASARSTPGGRWRASPESHGVTSFEERSAASRSSTTTRIFRARSAPRVAAARGGGFGRVVAVFQPHRYSRVATLAADFADAFEGADIVVITWVYAAGEAPRPGVSGRLVLDAVVRAHPETRAVYRASREDLVAYLRSVLQPGDICLTLAAGDLTNLAAELGGEALP